MPKKSMNLNKLNKIHFIGIGGIGISAVAKMMLELNKQVTGSDLRESVITQNLASLGAKIIIGHNVSNIATGIDLVVYSSAVPESNMERQKAKELNIAEISYGEFLGEYSKSKKTIAVTGTNGKTTTSAILGITLVDLGLDPTVIIGSRLKQFNGNFRMGKSNLFSLEADEYKANMLKIDPWSILLTSIEEDHLDFYKDLTDIIKHFQRFIDKLPTNGYLFYNSDDNNIGKLKLPGNSFGCSLKKPTDYWAEKINVQPGYYQFKVLNHHLDLGDFKISIPGRYNILNSLMVIGLCHKMGLDLDKVKASIGNFNGLWRRFEIVGQMKNIDDVLVVSDYTHHPAAIEKTLAAAKEFYPDRRLFLVYQPHQHDRTKKLFNDFLKCFTLADFTVLNEIYDVAGRKYDQDNLVSSKNIADEINNARIIYSPDFTETKKLIAENRRPHDLLLIMGAGDIDIIARELV